MKRPTWRGYGAGAVNPYLAFETIEDLICEGEVTDSDPPQGIQHHILALTKGVLKVMSKMGISTLQSYRGAQIFEAVGLDKQFVDRYFTWTASRIGGIGIETVAPEMRGTVTGIINLAPMLGAIAAQPAIGLLLDLHERL